MATRMTADYRTLSQLSRVSLLYTLVRRGPLEIDDLADATGLHPNTAREHLQRLCAAGFVHSTPVHTPTRGRPRMRYAAQADPADPNRPERVRRAFERAERVRRLMDAATAGERAAVG